MHLRLYITQKQNASRAMGRGGHGTEQGIIRYNYLVALHVPKDEFILEDKNVAVANFTTCMSLVIGNTIQYIKCSDIGLKAFFF